MFHVSNQTSLYCKNMDETSYIKGVQKEPFADVLQNCGVLKNFAKFTGKHGDSRTCVH